MKSGGMEMDGKNGKTFSHEELAKAMFHWWDLANSAFITFFPVHITADCIKHQKKYAGDAIYVAVPLKDMRTRYVYETIAAGTGKSQEEVQKDFEYLVGEIPVRVKVYTRDYKFFKYPDRTIYEFDDYLLPNPFDTYWKSRFLIK